MSILRQIQRGVSALLFPARADADVDSELTHFAEQRAREIACTGTPYDEAVRQARLEMGNVTVAREAVRASGWEHGLDLLLGDVRYAMRRLRREPGFTVVAALTLALGIGAATAIFSAVNPILFRALPYPGADRIVTISERTTSGSALDPAYGTYEELLSRARTLEAISVTDGWAPSLTGTNEPERLDGRRVSASFFRTIGVLPAVGRSFDASEDVPGAAKVAIVSDRLLQRRFGGDAAIVGRTVSLDGEPYLVVGVMPTGFVDVTAPSVDVWSPLRAQPRADPNSREWGHHYRIVARLAPGTDVRGAARELATIAANPVAEFPRVPWASLQQGVLVRGLQDDITASARPALLAIVAAAAVLLLMACVNVTNLLLARSGRRRSEFGVRAALGAGGGRLVRQLLTESVLLALLGGVLAFVIANAGVGALIALAPPGLPRVDAIRVDATAFAFALAVTTVVGVVVGLLPAFAASRADVRADMQTGSRTVARRSAARGVLVVTEVALALVLLVGAGLLLRSLDRLFAVSPGIQPAHVLTMQVVNPDRAASPEASDRARQLFFERVVDAARTVPGVTEAALTSQLPLSGDLDAYGYAIESRPDQKPGENGAALRYAVTPGYFRSMGIQLVRGRLLDATDRAEAAPSFVISETLARVLDGDPLGQHLRFGPDVDGSRPWGTVVGVVRDVKQSSLADQDIPAFYVPMAQWRWVDPMQSLVVRTDGDAAALTTAVKRAVWGVDRNKPITRVATMEELMARTAAQRRFASVIYETFAIAALLLAAVGLYGVISGRVAERTREIGIRTALGATRGEIVSGVLRNGLALTAAGVIIGAASAVATTRLLETLLYGITRADPVTYASVIALLAGVAALACWAPARRAAGIDPVITLRAE